jgi:hypothetical protein
MPGALVAGCGASFQVTYECDVHFEHCYALEETAAASEVKRRCWNDWLAGYTFGQPRDRVDFAASRVRALGSPSGLADNDPPAPSASHAVANPLPTTAFAPPPPTASVSASPAPSVAVAELDGSALRPPGAECAAACEQRWSACRDGCRDGVCARCDRTYRTCVSVCLH